MRILMQLGCSTSLLATRNLEKKPQGLVRLSNFLKCCLQFFCMWEKFPFHLHDILLSYLYLKKGIVILSLTACHSNESIIYCQVASQQFVLDPAILKKEFPPNCARHGDTHNLIGSL